MTSDKITNVQQKKCPLFEAAMTAFETLKDKLFFLSPLLSLVLMITFFMQYMYVSSAESWVYLLNIVRYKFHCNINIRHMCVLSNYLKFIILSEKHWQTVKQFAVKSKATFYNWTRTTFHEFLTLCSLSTVAPLSK